MRSHAEGGCAANEHGGRSTGGALAGSRRRALTMPGVKWPLEGEAAAQVGWAIGLGVRRTWLSGVVKARFRTSARPGGKTRQDGARRRRNRDRGGGSAHVGAPDAASDLGGQQDRITRRRELERRGVRAAAVGRRDAPEGQAVRAGALRHQLGAHPRRQDDLVGVAPDALRRRDLRRERRGLQQRRDADAAVVLEVRLAA